MELKQLEAFVNVVDEKSFSGAARKLSLTQPTISAHIASLEKELDTQLLERTTKKLSLTVKGAQLYDYSVSMLRIRDKIYDEFLSPHKKIIELGASTIPSAYVLPEVLTAFGKLNPDVYFNSKVSDSAGVIEWVLDGLIDFGLVGTRTDDPALSFIPFLDDELIIAAPVTEHYMELSRSYSGLQDMIREPFIMREKGSGTKKEMDRILEQRGITADMLNVVARMNDLESIKRSVINGLGITIISAKSVQELQASRQILTFPIDSPPPMRRLFLVSRRGRNLPQQSSHFMQFLRNYYQK